MITSRKANAPLEASTIDRAKLHDAIRLAGDRIAEMIRDLPDTSVRVPGSDWTVGDTAAHVVLASRLYVRLLSGGSSPFTGRDSYFTDGRPRSPVNAQVLAELPERRPGKLADLLIEETRALLETAGRSPDDGIVRWHWMDMDLGAFTGVALMHALEHGYDIAGALRRPFPISPADARLALRGLMAIMAPFLDKEAARGIGACLEIRIRGGARAFLLIEDEKASVHAAPPRRVDCHLSAEPVALLLVALGRVSQWGPITRGRLVAWGRKPWLAMKLTKLFPAPG
jgi:uncharacterized protein (TIGR03083 family)